MLQHAVGITLENWTNQRLEFPELSTAEGAVDRERGPTNHIVKIIFIKTMSGLLKGKYQAILLFPVQRT